MANKTEHLTIGVQFFQKIECVRVTTNLIGSPTARYHTAIKIMRLEFSGGDRCLRRQTALTAIHAFGFGCRDHARALLEQTHPRHVMLEVLEFVRDDKHDSFARKSHAKRLSGSEMNSSGIDADAALEVRTVCPMNNHRERIRACCAGRIQVVNPPSPVIGGATDV